MADTASTLDHSFDGSVHPKSEHDAWAGVMQAQLTESQQERESGLKLTKLFDKRESALERLDPLVRMEIERRRCDIARSSDPGETARLRKEIDQATPELGEISKRIDHSLESLSGHDRTELQARNDKFYDPYGELVRLAETHGVRLDTLVFPSGGPMEPWVSSKAQGNSELPLLPVPIDLKESKEKLVPLFDELSRLGKQGAVLDSKILFDFGLSAQVKESASGRRLALTIGDQAAAEEIPVDFDKPLVPQLNEILEERQAAIEKRFNVKIARKGDEAVEKVDADNMMAGGKMLYARTTNFAETVGLERALERSYTGLPPWDQPPLKIASVREQTVEHEGMFATGHYVHEHGGNATTTFESSSSKNPEGADESWTHEFAHQAQDKIWGSTGNMPSNIEEKLGWSLGLFPNNQGVWTIGGRLKMKDGSGYCNIPRPEGSISRDQWIPCINVPDNITDLWLIQAGSASELRRTSGELIAKPDKSEIVNSEAVRKKALVPPSSDYFINPIEEHADGLTNLRFGDARRKKLLQDSPVLYEIVKSDDQRTIDMTYPPIDGKSQYIRTPDGKVVKNDAAAQALVQEFERGVN